MYSILLYEGRVVFLKKKKTATTGQEKYRCTYILADCGAANNLIA
jgi:hypothetical protein